MRAKTIFEIFFAFIVVEWKWNVLCLDLRECNRPLGMESGRILDSQLSASSSHDNDSTGPQHSRIRKETGSGAWCPRNQINITTKEWIQIDFHNETIISAIESQGRFDRGRGMEYPPGYMVEYWRESLGKWARYKDYKSNEIIAANTDTRSVILRILDGGIIGQKIRIIPVSENTRTVCMRLEIYGCQYKESLLWYSLPEGSVADGLDMRDTSFDGCSNESNVLSRGLGKLYDGKIGEDNFEKHPDSWIGWRKGIQGPSVTLEFAFSRQLNISSISLHASNFLKHRSQVFEWASIWFSPLGNNIYSPRAVYFNYLRDSLFESARWVRIPIPDRLAKRVKIILYFGNETEWLLLSEVKFEIGRLQFSLSSNNDEHDDAETREIEQAENENSPTFFSVADSIEDNDGWQLAAIAASIIFLSTITLFLAYITCFYRNSNSKHQTISSFGIGDKDIQLMMLQDGSIKRISPSAYRMAVDNIENTLIEKMPIYCSSDSEYADPDSTRSTNDSCPRYYNRSTGTSQSSNKQSFHYAASDVTRLISFPNEFSTASTALHSPQTAVEQTGRYDNNYVPDFSNMVEIDPQCLQIKEPIGKGEFGEVHLCQLEHRLVAVKVLKKNADVRSENDFKKEIELMGRLKHQNVIEVIGICSKTQPLCCIIEYMLNGDLCRYLQRQTIISSESLSSICTQIAAGMSYLETQNFVHRDLAARNCFVSDDGIVKVGDFGMARELYNCDYYKFEGNSLLPIRWMAWECLLLGRFSNKSDVWSFGVTMWEVLNRCNERPFSSLSDDAVIDNIRHICEYGYLKRELEKPKHCSINFFQQLIVPCWMKNEDSRPTFNSIHRHLQSLNFVREWANPCDARTVRDAV